MNNRKAGLEVHTIGHSNVSAESILGLLGKYRIEVLVDVRSSPYSKHAPQFNRETLRHTLRLSGIEYCFAGKELGGRPKDPSCYVGGALPSPAANHLKLVKYDEVAQCSWYKRGIRSLVSTAQQHRTVVMCSEEDPNRCHRQQLIAQTLLPMDVVVWHIRRDGNREPAQSETAPGSLVSSAQELSTLF